MEQVTTIPPVSVTGLPASLKRRLFRAIRNDLPQLSAPLRIDVVDTIHARRCDVLWYGGAIAKLHYKGWIFELYAAGDVYADLYEGDDHILYVKDKSNAGRLGEELIHYIQTDKELKAIRKGTHNKYRLELGHNNWWECFAYDPTGEFLDLMWALDSDDFFEAIAEIVSGMDSVIEENS